MMDHSKDVFQQLKTALMVGLEVLTRKSAFHHQELPQDFYNKKNRATLDNID